MDTFYYLCVKAHRMDNPKSEPDAVLDCLSLVASGSCICEFSGTVANKEIVLNPAIPPGLDTKAPDRPSLPRRKRYICIL